MTTRVYLFTLYERVWHWLQALTIFGLILTGAELHWPGSLPLLGLRRAAAAHEFLSVLLLGNALLGLFHHLVTGQIRQFVPERDFFSLAARQARYYLGGIFRREKDPFTRSPGRKLNPLQQVTYLMVLNVVLPAQAVTGLLLWHGPAARWVGTVHVLGAWLFSAFLIAHLYLATTGHKPTAHLQAMLSGWQSIHHEQPEESDVSSECDAREPEPAAA